MSNLNRYNIANCKFLCSTIQASPSGEFVKFDEIKELLKLSPNIDYAAALREIEQVLVPGRYTMRRKIMYIESIMSRLNSQKKDRELRII
jgi:hypothetical protein